MVLMWSRKVLTLLAVILYKASHSTNMLQPVQRNLLFVNTKTVQFNTVNPNFAFPHFSYSMHFLYGLSQMPIRTMFPRFYAVQYFTPL